MVSEMSYKVILLAIVAATLLASVSAQAATTSVNIKNNAFSPQSVTIKAGDTVTWTNQDSVQHNVDFESFKSDLLSQGQTYSHTFDTPGSYSYDCDVHPFMKGTVIVK